MEGNTTKIEDGALIITRTFNAPRAQVWKMFTEVDEVKKWWGPKKFTAPHITIDFKEGGKYLYCMHGEEGLPEEMVGKDFWSTGTYQEIVPMEKLVMTDSFSDKDGKVISGAEYGMPEMPMELLVTITFEDAPDGKTKMTLTHVGFPPSEIATQTGAGWNESFDKIDTLLA